MNLPNKITLFRLIIALPYISLLYYYFNENGIIFAGAGLKHVWIFYLCLGIFIVAMISDFVDGYLARKKHQVTTFGKIADPIADKIITTSTLIFLSIFSIVPLWITIIFILRDIIIDGVRNLYAAKGIRIEASPWGKMKTVMQSVGIVAIWAYAIAFINYPFYFVDPDNDYYKWIAMIPLIVALGLSLYSAFDYLKPLPKYLKFK